MPLSSLLAGEPIYAFNFTPEAWKGLRAQAKDLRFPCCDAGVILKTSHVGTQFFAHARKGICVTAPESQDHLAAKDVIAKAAIAAGWEAETEVRGTTPAGEAWTADVMVTRGSVKLAFEVQLARQVDDVTRTRQARYMASGVRALWLMRQPARIELPRPSKSLPLFRIESTPEGFQVGIDWNYSFSRPALWVPLGEFVTGALSKRLVWRPLTGKTVSVKREVYRRTCKQCEAWNAFPDDARAIGTNEVWFNQTSACQRLPALLSLLYPEQERARHQIASTSPGSYSLWNSCRKCGTGMMDTGRRFGVHHRPLGAHRTLPPIYIRLTDEILDAMKNESATDVWGWVSGNE